MSKNWLEIHTTIAIEGSTSTSTRLRLDFLSSLHQFDLSLSHHFGRLFEIWAGRDLRGFTTRPGLPSREMGPLSSRILTLSSLFHKPPPTTLGCVGFDSCSAAWPLLPWHVRLILPWLLGVIGWFGRSRSSDSSRVDDVDQRSRQENLLGNRNSWLKLVS